MQNHSESFIPLLNEIEAEITAFGNNKPHRNFCILSRPGGGKTHLLKLIARRTTNLSTIHKITSIRLSSENTAVLSERELSIAVARKAGFAGSGGSFKDVAMLSAQSGEKILLLMENPEKFILKDFREIIASAADSESMFILASDSEKDIMQLPHFQIINLPLLSNNDIIEFLREKGLEKESIDKALKIFELYNFLPTIPGIVSELSKIFRLFPQASNDDIIQMILEKQCDRYRCDLTLLSPQQRYLLLSLGKNDFLSSPRELSEDTGLEIPVINSQLKRMRDFGILKEVSAEYSGSICHYFVDSLYHLWMYYEHHDSFMPFTKLIECMNVYKKYTGDFARRFMDFAINHYIAPFTPQCQVDFLLSPESFPLYPYEGLTKTVVSYIRGGDFRRAETMMEAESERSAAAGLKERSARALLFAGVARASMSNYEGAKSAFKESAARGEKSPLLWINYGAVYYREGNIMNARNCFQQAVKTVEKLPHAFANLGAVLFIGGELNMAEDAYLRALKLKENCIPAIIGLANIHYQWNEPETALKMYEDAVKLAPDNIPALQNAAYLAFIEGNNTLCADYCAKILSAENEISKLALSAELTETLRQTVVDNYGMAKKSFIDACNKMLVIDESQASEVLTIFFLALAGTGKYQFWLELYSIINYAHFADSLKLLRAAVSLKMGNNLEADRILPMEKQYFNDVLSYIS